MLWQNLKVPSDICDFGDAVLRGLGQDGGLYMPQTWPKLPQMDDFLALDFPTRCAEIGKRLLAPEISPDVVDDIFRSAFDFPLPLVDLGQNQWVLELFHGPTLAFKDFGARFMARILQHVHRQRTPDRPVTILTATSGDTGAAVAHAFKGLAGIHAVILYPADRISQLQERLFTTLGGNIHTLAVAGDFDHCQAMVKACFKDASLVKQTGLNSANSINVARLLAQVFYYVEAAAFFARKGLPAPTVSVPCGNFGNLTAGLLAERLGAPLASFIAATNANDTVPRFLREGTWQVRPTVATLSNAMDVSAPNNWPRTAHLLADKPTGWLRGVAFDDEATRHAMRQLHARNGYVADPHTAVGWAALDQVRHANQHHKRPELVLGTAHPAKFQDRVSEILDIAVPLPTALADALEKPNLSQSLPPDKDALRHFLQDLPHIQAGA